TSWNEFSSTMAYAIICLANNLKFNFSKYIIDNLKKNLEAGVPFYIFPWFIQVFVNHQLGDMSHHKDTPIPDAPSSSQHQRKHKPKKKERKETKVSPTKIHTEDHVVEYPTIKETIVDKEESSKQGRKIADIDADERLTWKMKGFCKCSIENELRKFKGNSVDTKFAKTSILGKPVLQPPRNQSVVRQLNAFKSERTNFSKPRIATPTLVSPREPIPIVNKTDKPVVTLVVQVVLWYLDSGCSKHMIRDRSQLVNFVQKFLGTVKFGNDHVAKIMGYGDYQIENVTISRVYYVEGLGHNLFSVGQFCDSDLEVAFRQHTCFIRNLDGVDLLIGSRGNNLYTMSLQDMMASSPICLLSKASKTKSWLWHHRLSHLNFGAINHLARQGLVRGLSKLKFEKDHLCSACAMGKSTMKIHKPKSKDTNQEKLYLLHMDLCGPMRVESVNGKKYILVIVDDYSRFTWVRLKVSVRRIRTDNGIEFVNHTLRDYYEEVGISHETSVARSPQQNEIVERCNRTLIEAARTMLIYAQAPLFLWAEAVATACFTQNHSVIRL
nr:retrovirus-related Pol polyprotein from transposon TNT 1-94 [Tanacetum cinerariifolium]